MRASRVAGGVMTIPLLLLLLLQVSWANQEAFLPTTTTSSSQGSRSVRLGYPVHSTSTKPLLLLTEQNPRASATTTELSLSLSRFRWTRRHGQQRRGGGGDKNQDDCETLPVVILVDPAGSSTSVDSHCQLPQNTRSRLRRILQRVNTLLVAAAIVMLPMKQQLQQQQPATTMAAATPPSSTWSRTVDYYDDLEQQQQDVQVQDESPTMIPADDLESTTLLAGTGIQRHHQHHRQQHRQEQQQYHERDETMPVSLKYYSRSVYPTTRYKYKDILDPSLLGYFGDDDDHQHALRSWSTLPPANPKPKPLAVGRTIPPAMDFLDMDPNQPSTDTATMSTTSPVTTATSATTGVQRIKTANPQQGSSSWSPGTSTMAATTTATTTPSNMPRSRARPLVLGVTTGGGVLLTSRYIWSQEKNKNDSTTRILSTNQRQGKDKNESNVQAAPSTSNTQPSLNKTLTPTIYLAQEDPVRKSQALQRAQETKKIVSTIRARRQEERDDEPAPLASSFSLPNNNKPPPPPAQQDESLTALSQAALQALDRIDRQLQDHRQQWTARALQRTAQINALQQKRHDRERVSLQQNARRNAQEALESRKAAQEANDKAMLQMAQRQERMQRKLMEERYHQQRIAAIKQQGLGSELGEIRDAEKSKWDEKIMFFADASASMRTGESKQEDIASVDRPATTEDYQEDGKSDVAMLSITAITEESSEAATKEKSLSTSDDEGGVVEVDDPQTVAMVDEGNDEELEATASSQKAVEEAISLPIPDKENERVAPLGEPLTLAMENNEEVKGDTYLTIQAKDAPETLETKQRAERTRRNLLEARLALERRSQAEGTPQMHDAARSLESKRKAEVTARKLLEARLAGEWQSRMTQAKAASLTQDTVASLESKQGADLKARAPTSAVDDSRTVSYTERVAKKLLEARLAMHSLESGNEVIDDTVPQANIGGGGSGSKSSSYLSYRNGFW